MTIRHADLTTPSPAYSISLAQISGAAFACGPLLAATALALGRFTPVVMLDVLGCWALAAALLAGHRLSQRLASAGEARALRNLACLLGFGAVGLAVVVSYNVQVAGPDAQAGTVSGSAEPGSGAQPLQPQGTTNITVHCDNNQSANRPRGRR